MRIVSPVVVLLLVIAGVWPDTVSAQTDAPLTSTRYQPGLQFRTIAAGRFRIYFHQGEEALVQRLVRIVREVAPDVDRRLGAPSGIVHVILVDQTDVSNGWATVIPYNLIEIAAVPPQASSMIGNTDDWLRLVFAHEYTHVVHLEKSGGWLGKLRHVFGRLPFAYPNLFLPGWQIEGIATFEESAITRGGRVHAGDFRMLMDEAARARRFAPLDRAGGGVVDWPGGAVPYLYGAYFHEYLAARFGEESLARLAEATASRLPFLGSRAFKPVFGQSLASLWKQFEADVTRRVNAENVASPRTRLTTHGFGVEAPAFSADGRLFYGVANPHGFPSLMEWREGDAPRSVASRYQGNRLSVAAEAIVFDQLEVVGNISLLSDIYAADIETGATRRLTREARAADPDVSPDGKTIACTVQTAGRRFIATFDMPGHGAVAVPTPLVSEGATEFSNPRWSPDGRLLVAERRRLDGPSEIVTIDVQSRAIRSVVSSRQARNISPVWIENGAAILFATSTPDRGFRLRSVDLKSGVVRELADAGVGAQSPALSPDGTRLVFVGYSPDGYDLYSLPIGSLRWTAVAAEPAVLTLARGESAEPSDVNAIATSTRYSPWPTLTPRFWVPYFEADGEHTIVGAATGGFDALGRHAYALTAGWAVPRNRADVQAEYSYTRWWPALFVGASDDTDAWRGGHLRARDASAGVLLPLRRVRWTADLLGAVSASREDLEPLNPAEAATRRRNAARFDVSLSNLKAFGYSISREQGLAIGVTSELAAGDAGATARTVVGEFRAYVPVVPQHGVLAMRVAGATSRGDDRVRREFSAAGSGPQGGGFGVGVNAVGLLRGFAADDVFGRTALVANVDYRVPLGWPQRGLGTLPFLLRAVHGAVFADVANAWDDTFRSAHVRRSAGAELSFDFVVGWSLPVTVSTGVAWRHDPVTPRRAAVAFARVGRAF